MRIGMTGLGRMGSNMAKRLIQNDHEVVVFNRTEEKIKKLADEGAIASSSLNDLVSKLDSPKIVWLMLPAGKIVDRHIDLLKQLLDKGDIIIEGGNSFYKDDIRRADELSGFGIKYMDAGISGGIWGLEKGFCSMYGGERDVFSYIEPVAKSLAPEKGYLYCGPAGAGHFVKMIHNGIEYAMMQAYGEGFEILKASDYGQELDFGKIAGLWNKGSVIRSWLLELLENAFSLDPDLEKIQGFVEDSGEARWTVKQAVDSGVAADVITSSLYKRFSSRQEDIFANKVTAALRNEFGGHAVVKKGEKTEKSSAGAGKTTHAKPEI